MRAIFFHDHLITEKEGTLYSTGGLNNKVIKRYQNVFEKFSLGTRNSPTRPVENLSFIADTKDVTHISIPNLASFRPSNYRKAYRIISQAIDENDFVIVRLPSIIGFMAAHLAIKKNKPYAVELVGCPWDAFSNYSSIKGRIIAGPFYLITKHFVKNTENALYVTTQFLQKRYPSNAANQIGCSDVELIIEKDRLGKRFDKITNVKNEPIKLGMIGSLEAKYKGFDTAIKALHLLKQKGEKNFILEIVGGGKKESVQKLIDAHELNDQVFLKGTLSHPEGIFGWLDSVDVFLQPSRVEGLPRALVEAMSRGCVCLGSDIGGIPELLEKGSIHKKDDFNKLSTLILELKNVEVMSQKTKECFTKASEFDKEVLDAKREKFYLKCISQPELV